MVGTVKQKAQDLGVPPGPGSDEELPRRVADHVLGGGSMAPGAYGLKTWGNAMAGGVFVFTSNVDGQFQSAGFGVSNILECHGSIHHLQCVSGCCSEIWPAHEVSVDVDECSFRAKPPLPSCPHCGGLARPNVLMFGDWGWQSQRTSAQGDRFETWLHDANDLAVVVVEMGAGTAVPTVRMTAEQVAVRTGGTLVRINPREPRVPFGQISISGPAYQSLDEIDRLL